MKPLSVNITTFVNPYSFFCVVNDGLREMSLKYNDEGNIVTTKSISDVNHGQYVAVMWKKKWTRGVITMESQFLIWLVDYGIFVHPDDKSIYVDLPVEYRKCPTNVFEAAIHGVVPLDKCLSNDLVIENIMTTSWNKGAIEKCQELIKKSINIYFVPLALMSTKSNDIVLGDVHLEFPGKKIVNLIDELELWPVFLERNKTVYIENLSKYYITRRKHRACILKPKFVEGLQVVTQNMLLEEYATLIEKQSNLSLELQCPADSSDDDSDVVTEVQDKKNKDAYMLSAAEIEKYSNLHITVHGHRYNVLNVLVNKARDLRMCDRYKDLRSIGRGYTLRGHGRDCFN